jgi:ADP-heptose:LPS heptosyltransferase
MSAKMTPKKVAILRFSSIGDIVLISPVIRALHASGTYELHFVTKRTFAQVNLNNKYLKKQHLFDIDPKEILPLLKEQDFHFVVDLHKNIRSKRLVRALGVKSATFPKLNIEKWLLVNFKIDRLPDRHIVDRYMEAIQSLDHQRDYAGLDMFIAADQSIDLDIYDLQANDYMVFVLGAAHFTKRIPGSILKTLIQRTSGKIALIGGPAEQAQGEELSALDRDRVVNFCGSTSLQQSAYLIQQSSHVLTADTGMMHIAAAFHKRIVVLWGNTIPKLGMYPYYGQHPNLATHFEVHDLSCRPCSKIGFQSCPKGHFDCMMQQDVDGILASLLAY